MRRRVEQLNKQASGIPFVSYTGLWYGKNLNCSAPARLKGERTQAVRPLCRQDSGVGQAHLRSTPARRPSMAARSSFSSGPPAVSCTPTERREGR